MPNLYVIAGPNGAGKTTASFTVLPEILGCREFVNADEIARGLSPFNVEAVAMQAARITLERMAELMEARADFAIETTGATRSYVNLVRDAQARGYRVVLLYFWLKSPELAIERVALRVSKGGHHIPPEDVHRRYKRGIQNLLRLFIPIVNEWEVYDNSFGERVPIARGFLDKVPEIYRADLWDRLHEISHD